MPSTLRPRSTYSGTGLKKRPLKKKSTTISKPPIRYTVSAVPSGFVLITTPTKTNPGFIQKQDTSLWNESTLPKLYASLLAWANKNNLQLEPTDFAMVRYNEWSECYIWSKFNLTYNIRPNNEKFLGSHKCGQCQAELKAGQTMCTSCTRFASCDGCFTSGLTLHGVPGASGRFCGRCAVECTKSACSNLVAPNDTIKECTSCCPRAGCTVCKVVHKKAELKKHTHKSIDYDLCTKCAGLICEKCGVPNSSVSKKTVGKTTLTACAECIQKVYDKERSKFEKWSEDEMPTSGSLVVPSLPNRPVRTVSIETEFDGNGIEAAKALYRAGLIESPNKLNYSAQGNSSRYPCILKSDGSVSGGELVTYLIDLDNENHASALLRMTEVMRGCRETGHAKFSSKAGGHVHIDLHSYSIEDLWGLYTIFKYLEMPLYYLAGAGATYGHRSLNGSSYANPPVGGPYGTKEAFAQGFRRAGRSGLNLNNYNGALQSCRCGAVTTGDWKKCSCNLGKATAEWRLWNAEITPRILHAWLALMQSITAYAEGNTINESNYQYLPWQNQHFSSIAENRKNDIKDRLTWMFTELVLTDSEKDSIIYAIKQSELAKLPSSFIDGLSSTRSRASSKSKDKPRNPSSRKGTKFALKEHTDNLAETPSEASLNSVTTSLNSNILLQALQFDYAAPVPASRQPRYRAVSGNLW